MDMGRFQAMVDRLERESAASPGAYRLKVALLALLGFGILALLLGAIGLGLVLLLGIAAAIAFSGGAALLLLFKLGKLLIFLAWPLWLLVKSAVRALFVRLPAPEGREITRAEAPALFDALDRMRRQMKGPRFHRVLVVDGVNAAVVQRPAFGLVGWPRNHLLLGLPLLEALPPDEALAVVAHEYGHLAGAHGHFSAFIYRLRLTWGTVQAFTDQVQGWLGRLVAPLVRWYAPYFNAYTFVLARANEYQADAASAELVGRAHAASALKRVNLVGPAHSAFLQTTLAAVDRQPAPPPDLLQRWSRLALQPPAEADGQRWLRDALDRSGRYDDTHPTLRARLQALALPEDSLNAPPPAPAGPSAAQAWLGALLPTLRGELESAWARDIQAPWAERFQQAEQARQRLAELNGRPLAGAAEEIERLRLMQRLEPDTDLREALADFNARHADHALGLYLEACARLDQADRAGLVLLERVIALDPEATLPCCERAHAFLKQAQDGHRPDDDAAAEAWAERWRQRDAMERERAAQIDQVDPKSTLVAAALDADTLARLRALVQQGSGQRWVRRVWLARRVIPADPLALQYLLGVELSWWGRRRGKQSEVVQGLARLEWPLSIHIVSLEGRFKALKPRFEALGPSPL